jgi:hypothetical protein
LLVEDSGPIPESKRESLFLKVPGESDSLNQGTGIGFVFARIYYLGRRNVVGRRLKRGRELSLVPICDQSNVPPLELDRCLDAFEASAYETPALSMTG